MARRFLLAGVCVCALGAAMAQVSVPTSGTTLPFLNVGSPPVAVTGAIRLPNNVNVNARNGANNGDVSVFYVDTANNLVLSQGNVATIPGGSGQTLGSVASPWQTVIATAFQLNLNSAAVVAVSPPYVCSNTAASAAITNTASKTYFNLTCAVPANLLSAGKSVKLEARGVYGAAVANTITTVVDLCTVSGCGSGTVVNLATSAAATPGAVSNQGWVIDENVMVYTTGSSGTADTQGYVAYQTAALVITFDPTPNTATATINTTVQQFVSVAVTWSAADVNDTITLRNFKVSVQ